MSLDVTIFDLRTVKRYYLYFVAFNIVVVVIPIILKNVFNTGLLDHNMVMNNNWTLLIILLALSLAVSWVTKNELKRVLATEDVELQYKMFERYYQRKLIWNSFSIVVSGILYLASVKNLFLYILLTQLLFLFVFYPTRKLIVTELKNPDIVFA